MVQYLLCDFWFSWHFDGRGDNSEGAKRMVGLMGVREVKEGRDKRGKKFFWL